MAWVQFNCVVMTEVVYADLPVNIGISRCAGVTRGVTALFRVSEHSGIKDISSASIPTHPIFGPGFDSRTNILLTGEGSNHVSARPTAE